MLNVKSKQGVRVKGRVRLVDAIAFSALTLTPVLRCAL